MLLYRTVELVLDGCACLELPIPVLHINAKFLFLFERNMENECSKCDGTFSTNDRQVQCSLCKDFFHVKCSVGTVKAFDLHKTKGFHWFCDDCDSENIAAELGELRKFKSNYDDIVSKFDNLQHKQSEYDERLDRIETKLVEIGSQKSVIDTTVNESL